jgi:tyrosyl-tRNA synthetase
MRLAHLLVALKLAPSNTEARRLIDQGGVTLDDTRAKADVDVPVHDGLMVRVGRRRFARVRLTT